MWAGTQRLSLPRYCGSRSKGTGCSNVPAAHDRSSALWWYRTFKRWPCATLLAMAMPLDRFEALYGAEVSHHNHNHNDLPLQHQHHRSLRHRQWTTSMSHCTHSLRNCINSSRLVSKIKPDISHSSHHHHPPPPLRRDRIGFDRIASSQEQYPDSRTYPRWILSDGCRLFDCALSTECWLLCSIAHSLAHPHPRTRSPFKSAGY